MQFAYNFLKNNPSFCNALVTTFLSEAQWQWSIITIISIIIIIIIIIIISSLKPTDPI